MPIYKRNMAKRNMTWFVIGIGVGTIVSLLFAPATGEELQRQIASSAREGAERARRRGRQVVETVSDNAARGRQQVREMVGKGEDAVETGGSQLSEYAERARDVISEQIGSSK